MMTREEAFLIFDKLRAEESMVLCMGRLSGWTCAIRGRIVSASLEEVVLVSDDRHSASVSIRLDADDLIVRYAEPRDMPILQGMSERDMTLASIMVGLPLRMRPADYRARLLEAPQREMLLFLELPPKV